MKLKLFLLVLLLMPLCSFSAVKDEYLVGLGNTYLDKGMLDKARLEFTQALSANPSNQEAKAALEGMPEIPKEEGLISSFSFLGGFIEEENKYEDHYKGIPLFFSFGFDAKPFFSKIGLHTKGRLEFVLEPFVNAMFEPKANVELGSNFLIEYAFPLTKKFQPYIKGGLGVAWMSQHIEEQATQYNFLPQGALGFHYLIKDNVALSCEFRHRHLSNAGIKDPNKGVDASLYLAGFTFYFK
ncbi:MAG: acyloxyacyl hydrolase [Candidatus Omnitrophica bacterium]|nr:acyloxyacyl hydrolase [Candidatus Omnitrophota bacterium]MDD5429126.1 acyloxyacyl hydrolase [Candidatus Omnitrophota bacterium]